MVVEVYSWDASVYDGICQFHEAKGFDPYSQEVAIELGDPLVHLSCDRDALRAHIQSSDDGDWYSDSDGDSYTEDGSESGDEQYDSASSELGDALPIHQEDIDSIFCDAPEHQHEFIPTANECPSPVSEQFFPTGSQCCAPAEAELLAPSQSFNIAMAVQFILILAATVFSLYEYIYPRS
ncbi:hypothetical protein B0H13DRAFT_2387254 [Mycena leptocephala]|nr:hypothetical protein B0H13DRAFT_2387254 [Mycena leptocephala]